MKDFIWAFLQYVVATFTQVKEVNTSESQKGKTTKKSTTTVPQDKNHEICQINPSLSDDSSVL